MSLISYQRERARDLWADINPLLQVHWREIATYEDIPLDPDVDRYNAMDDAGAMRCYTARAEGALIGYAVFSLATNMHYRSSAIAVQDVLFVLPEHRKTRAGLGLIRYTERELKKEGVILILQHEKIANPELGVILERLGYEALETIRGKRLDKGD